MRILIFGGDARQISASVELKDKGFDTYICGIDKDFLEKYGVAEFYTEYYTGFDVLVFPLPLSTDAEHVNCPFSKTKYKVTDILKRIDKNTKVFSGMPGIFFKNAAKEFKIDMFDYYECEELQIKNSVPTAEGAIWTFMNNKDITVFESECIVVGCGKIGKCLADRLYKLGANVIISARSARDLSWAECAGMKSISIEKLLSDKCFADCIFNTVPCNIFNLDFVNKMSDRTIYIELASKPYGMNEETSEYLKDRHIRAPSLPGKTAPVTAGRIIADTICKYI